MKPSLGTLLSHPVFTAALHWYRAHVSNLHIPLSLSHCGSSVTVVRGQWTGVTPRHWDTKTPDRDLNSNTLDRWIIVCSVDMECPQLTERRFEGLSSADMLVLHSPYVTRVTQSILYSVFCITYQWKWLRGLLPLKHLDRVFESHQRHECLCLLFVCFWWPL
jgi:hypothetical protein